MWLSQSPLRQFRAIPDAIARKLEKKDIAWERYYDMTPQVGRCFDVCRSKEWHVVTWLPKNVGRLLSSTPPTNPPNQPTNK